MPDPISAHEALIQRLVRQSLDNDGRLDPRESLTLELASEGLDRVQVDRIIDAIVRETGKAGSATRFRAHLDVLTPALAAPGDVGVNLRRSLPNKERFAELDQTYRNWDPALLAVIKLAAADGVVHSADWQAINEFAARAREQAAAAGRADAAALYPPAAVLAALQKYGPPGLVVKERLDSPSSPPTAPPATTPPATSPPATAPDRAPAASRTSPTTSLAGSRYADYRETVPAWDEQFWARQPNGPRPDQSGAVPGDPMAYVERLLAERYPAGLELVRRAREVERQTGRRDLDNLARQLVYANQHSVRELCDDLGTFIHEAGHIAASRYGGYQQNGFDWGDGQDHAMPPLKNRWPMGEIYDDLEPEDRTYLKSKTECYIKNPASPAIGTLSIERLLEETIQYGTSLLTSYAVADKTAGDLANDRRVGLEVAMRYLATYLGDVRVNNPAMYQELAGSNEWRELILKTWARSEYALALTERQGTVSLNDRKLDESAAREHRAAGFTGAPRTAAELLRQEKVTAEIRRLAAIDAQA